MALTSDAKRLLAETIRGTAQDPAKGLRYRLLEAIKSEAAGRYRLAVPLKDAGLDEAHRRRRERLEAYLDEKTRATKPKNAAEAAKTRERLLREAEKEAAATLLNRLITLRLLEDRGLSRPPVVTGGWNSKGYREFREFAPGLIDDETEGYALLLQFVFDDLATDLPGLFGDVGVTKLLPIPAKSLRDVVEALDNHELASAWTDDVTLGWVYQYWNDPDREALDWKISPSGGGGKILPHEVASKTQMFTERYMVEWLLQNSLGLTWLCMCKKHGWMADAERTLPVLDERRAAWRKKRDAGEVTLDALMPIEGELEEHWKYYVPQPLPDDSIASAPDSVKAIKLLDPACGSGHFLVIAFDLLASLYREEARHVGQTITDREIAESILENNLHGIDIDPRAIQIAAASLYLKAKECSKEARPKRLNLVAPALQLGHLPKDDPAVVQLRQDLKREVGIPEELTTKLLSSLAGVDYLGSLLKVDAAVDDALRSVERDVERGHPGQGDLYQGFPMQQVKLSLNEARVTVLDRLERFLNRHSSSEDLGLRLDGEQLAAGVRFVRIAKEGTYDLVVGNPPYSDVSLLAEQGYVRASYRAGRSNLYGTFLERSLDLLRPTALVGMVLMRGWLMSDQFQELRSLALESNHLVGLADLGPGAFEEVSAAQVVLSVAAVLVSRRRGTESSFAVRPTPPDDRASDGMTSRKRAAMLLRSELFTFSTADLVAVAGRPVLYSWSRSLRETYQRSPKLGEVAAVRQGMATTNNARFLRRPWEVRRDHVGAKLYEGTNSDLPSARWIPYIKGAAGVSWFEPLDDLVLWANNGLEVKVCNDHGYGSFSRNIKNESFYFRQGVAFSMIGHRFVARMHRYKSIIADKGSSVFGGSPEQTVCLLNSRLAREVMLSLGSSIGFQVGDVVRVPVVTPPSASVVIAQLREAFSEHERARETSWEFVRPAPSSWQAAAEWAEVCVSNGPNESTPSFSPRPVPPAPQACLSHVIGQVLGRFPMPERGQPAPAMIYIAACDGDDVARDAPSLREAWELYRVKAAPREDLGEYLRKSFFEFHKKLYENRPIYFPLSSARKSFVAFVSIHRWADDTLSVLLADHLMPTRKRLEGELDDLRTAKVSEKDKANGARAEKRFTEVQKFIEELNDFIAKVTEVAERGPPPSDDKTTKREVDAKFAMDLDDGVMVNSSALWPLLDPIWKAPKKWWKQLANAEGKKDYDWSHLAARYFPTRVRKKCQEDPSLAVAHGCFWELHPAKAYAWELRLQDEIKPEFTIDEPGSDAARKKFLTEHANQTREILANEVKRRERKAAKEESNEPLFDGDPGDSEAEEDSDD